MVNLKQVAISAEADVEPEVNIQTGINATIEMPTADLAFGTKTVPTAEQIFVTDHQDPSSPLVAPGATVSASERARPSTDISISSSVSALDPSFSSPVSPSSPSQSAIVSPASRAATLRSRSQKAISFPLEGSPSSISPRKADDSIVKNPAAIINSAASPAKIDAAQGVASALRSRTRR